MTAYKLTNVGLHIARRMFDRDYAKQQGNVGIFHKSGLSIVSAANFARLHLASSLGMAPPSSKGFQSVSSLLQTALEEKSVDDVGPIIDANKKVFDALIARGLIAEQHAAERGSAFSHEANPIQSIGTINLQVTLECNLRCFHCSRGGAREGQRHPLSLEMIEQALEEAFQANILQNLVINGGEPTLHKGKLFRLLEFAARKGIMVQIVSNGWWGEAQGFKIWGEKFKDAIDFTQRLAGYGAMVLHISLDGPPEIHDALRRKEGSFNAAVAAAHAARQAPIGSGQAGIMVRTNTVDHPLLVNFSVFRRDLRDVFALDLGDEHMFLSDMKRVGSAAANFPPAPEIAEENYLGACKGFFAPSDLIISPDGGVGTCGLCGGFGEFGHLRESSMTEILNGIQKTAAYQLHVARDLRPYMDLLPADIFAGHWDHPCQVWMALSMIVTRKAQKEKEWGRELRPRELRAVQAGVARTTSLGISKNPLG